MDQAYSIYNPGAIAIRGDRIVAVGKSSVIQKQYVANKIIDAKQQAVMPGLIDTYSHAGHGMIKAIWHSKRGWPGNPVYFHATDSDWWYTEGLLSSLERIRFGVTTGVTIIGATPARADSPVFALENARAVNDSGLRGIIGVGPPDPVIKGVGAEYTTLWENNRPRIHRYSYEDAMENTRHVIQSVHDPKGSMMQVCLAIPYLFGRYPRTTRRNEISPHYQQADRDLIIEKAHAAREFASKEGVLIHTHMFQSTLDEAVTHYGRDDVLKIMGSDVVIAHGNGLRASEIDLIAKTKAKVVSAPSMGENVWYGRCPVPELITAGACVAISTDGNAPYVSMDLLAQVYRSLFLNRLFIGDNDIFLPGKALNMITKDAATVIGMADRIGSLEPGKQADLIILDLNQPHLIPQTHLPQILAFYATGHDVVTTMVNGQILMEDRVVFSLDEEAVKERARDEIAKAFRRKNIEDYLELPDNYWTG